MSGFNSENEFDWYIEQLKKNYGFSQVFMTSSGQNFIYFECFTSKDGSTVEIRFNKADQVFELSVLNRWETIFIDDSK